MNNISRVKPDRLKRLRLIEDNGEQETSIPQFPGLTGKERLTYKQEQFARLVSKGTGYGEAYRQAYDVRPTTKPNTVYVQGSKLMDDPKIAHRVAVLAREEEERKPLDPVQTRQWIVKQLMAIASDEQGKKQDKLKALEMLGKVRGVGLFAEISEVEYSKTTAEERQAKLRAMLDSLDPKPDKGPEDLEPKPTSEPIAKPKA